jgi:low temperature requirement protein LtrA
MTAVPRPRRMNPVLRQTERVTPLELFFDLVFVLAITQCTALMAGEPTWEGLVKGMLVLAVLWWAWVAYSWLTSVVDPEEGAIRIAVFAAMAGLLVVALCVPGAFDDLALTFAIAYGVVRGGQVALLWISGRGDPALRRSTAGLAVGTAIGTGLLALASLFDGAAQGAIWALAIALDLGEPYLFGAEGWKLEPGHFAERHGLIIIIALGESIVAIGVGAEELDLDAGMVTAAVVGVALAAVMWWLYFDVVAIISAHLLGKAEVGREQNEMARDSYSYIHFPMMAGIILVALGLKKTLEHTGDPLEIEIAVALAGGFALYLLGHVAFRLRNVHTLSRQRLLTAVLSLAVIPLALEIPALATLGIVTALGIVLIAYEAIRFAERRDEIRHSLAEGAA